MFENRPRSTPASVKGLLMVVTAGLVADTFPTAIGLVSTVQMAKAPPQSPPLSLGTEGRASDVENVKTSTSRLTMENLTVISPEPFEAVTARFEAAIGHPDMAAFRKRVATATGMQEIEEFVQNALGSSGLMEFIRFDLGAVLRKERGANAPKIIRYVIGNPLVMRQLVQHYPDVGSYTPTTVLIDERADGVHLTYVTMESVVAASGDQHTLAIARDLDSKIKALLIAAAG